MPRAPARPLEQKRIGRFARPRSTSLNAADTRRRCALSSSASTGYARSSNAKGDIVPGTDPAARMSRAVLTPASEIDQSSINVAPRFAQARALFGACSQDRSEGDLTALSQAPHNLIATTRARKPYLSLPEDRQSEWN